MANKYQNLNQPQAGLDFHDLGILTTEEIIQLADDFIEESINNGYCKISFIVGVGKHSKNGAVIKPLLQKYLPTHPRVNKIQTGKFAHGGEGVLIADLL